VDVVVDVVVAEIAGSTTTTTTTTTPRENGRFEVRTRLEAGGWRLEV